MYSAGTHRSYLGIGSALAILSLLLAACGGSVGQSASEVGSSYPEEPITWVVAFDPGGGSDTEARRVQQALQDTLGTDIQIEYRSGGGGAVGWAELAKAEPDGYTVGGLVIPHIVIQPLALDNPGYQTDDLRSVAWQVGAPTALLVGKDSRFQTMQDFIDYAKANPGELTVGGVGNYSASDLALAQLTNAAGIEVSYVPVTGGAGPLISDLAGGHLDAVMLGTNHAAGSDEVKPLAVAGPERFEGYPDIPTFQELGYEVTIEYAWGVGMPADVSDDVATKFGRAVTDVMSQPEVKDGLLEQGLKPIAIGPGEAQRYVDEQKELYSELVPLVNSLHN